MEFGEPYFVLEDREIHIFIVSWFFPVILKRMFQKCLHRHYQHNHTSLDPLHIRVVSDSRNVSSFRICFRNHHDNKATCSVEFYDYGWKHSNLYQTLAI